MSTIFKLKMAYMTPLIKLIIKYPKLMESKLFLKVMQIFPEKISRSYDRKVKDEDIQYQEALSYGLSLVERNPQKILDLCTGTGFAAFLALSRFPDAIVTGVDLSQGMIELAKGKVSRSDVERIKFERGNAAELIYEDEAFDLVITSNAPVYLEEAVRVLKQGGDIIVSYSFGGKAFLHARNEIRSLLNENGLHMIHLENVGIGSVIHGRKNSSPLVHSE